MSRYPNEVHAVEKGVQEPKANGAREPWRFEVPNTVEEVDEMICMLYAYILLICF